MAEGRLSTETSHKYSHHWDSKRGLNVCNYSVSRQSLINRTQRIKKGYGLFSLPWRLLSRIIRFQNNGLILTRGFMDGLVGLNTLLIWDGRSGGGGGGTGGGSGEVVTGVNALFDGLCGAVDSGVSLVEA